MLVGIAQCFDQQFLDPEVVGFSSSGIPSVSLIAGRLGVCWILSCSRYSKSLNRYRSCTRIHFFFPAELPWTNLRNKFYGMLISEVPITFVQLTETPPILIHAYLLKRDLITPLSKQSDWNNLSYRMLISVLGKKNGCDLYFFVL